MIQLRPEQEEAVEKLRTGSILVGGVGSGKSITALAYFYNKVCRGDYTKRSIPLKPRPLYIITTAFKRDTLDWNGECARFGLSTDPLSSVAAISVTIDSWNNIKKYVGISGAFFIFDEQRVVGSGAWVRAFQKIAKVNDWILLSATPGDTWSDYIPVFVANGFYKNRTAFLKKHAIFDRFAKYPKISRYIYTDTLVKYRDRILVKMKDNRQTIRYVNDINVDYPKDIYNVAFKNRWNPFDDEPIRDAGQCCHILRKIVNTDNSRIDALLKLTQKHKRIIVFYNLNCELEILRTLGDSGLLPKNTVISERNGHKHDPVPNSDRWLYLVQYNAGSEGWNCILTNAVIFYSLNYSYKIMEQASGRIDRINSPYKDLYYYRFISKSTIDTAILSALKSKRNFNELAFVRT